MREEWFCLLLYRVITALPERPAPTCLCGDKVFPYSSQVWQRQPPISILNYTPRIAAATLQSHCSFACWTLRVGRFRVVGLFFAAFPIIWVAYPAAAHLDMPWQTPSLEKQVAPETRIGQGMAPGIRYPGFHLLPITSNSTSRRRGLCVRSSLQAMLHVGHGYLK